MLGFIYGGQTGETPETLARRREIQDALAAQIMGHAPTTALGGIGALLSGAALGYGRYRDNQAETAGKKSASDLFSSLFSGTSPSANTSVPNTTSVPNVPGTMANARDADRSSVSGYSPSPSMAALNSNDVYNGFMGTVKDKLTNPYALAAVASTANAESKFSPGNANRTWSDPSAEDPNAMAGGLMSWNGPRLKNLMAYAAAKGEKQGSISPQTQAEFFLNENPQLTSALQNAKSVEEAQGLMNNAWRFKGYDQPGGEAARRLQMAQGFLPKFQSADASTPGATNAQPMQVADNSNTMPAQASQTMQPAQTTQQPTSALAGVDPKLIAAMTNPWVSPEQKAVIKTMIDQQMQNADPMRQMELKKGQLELNALEHPKTARMLTAEEKASAGLPSDGVYQQETDGSIKTVRQPLTTPDAVRTLEARADEAGLKPGSPERAEFMKIGGVESKNDIVNAGQGMLYDKNKQQWLQAPTSAQPSFKNVSELRKEILTLPSYKNFTQAMPIYKSMVDTADRNSRASDLNLVYGLGKIMDPTSVVREGEMVMAKDTAGLPDWFLGAINSVNGGAALTPETRKAIMQEAYGRMGAYKSAFDMDTGMYGGIADRNKINRADVIPDFGKIDPYTPPVTPDPTANADQNPATSDQPFWTNKSQTTALPSQTDQTTALPSQTTTVQPNPQVDLSAAPAGIDPALWGHLTPAEKQQFLNSGKK